MCHKVASSPVESVPKDSEVMDASWAQLHKRTAANNENNSFFIYRFFAILQKSFDVCLGMTVLFYQMNGFYHKKAAGNLRRLYRLDCVRN